MTRSTRTALTKKAARKKIVAHLERRGHVSDFKVTPVLVARWWNLINEALFDGKLIQPHRIVVRKFRNDHGWCIPMAKKGKVILGINSDFFDRKQFICVLVHEMVHQWEWSNGFWSDNPSQQHDKSFWQWKQPIKEILNLPLYESY
jgi:hypothetical protein